MIASVLSKTPIFSQKIAITISARGHPDFLQFGVIHTDTRQLTVEPLTEDHPEFEAAAAHRLFKRETFFDQMVTI
jgi:hypothetical protein